VKVLRGSWEDWDAAATAVAIGVFDGVHRGHHAVLDRLRADGLVRAVVTFDPHPLTLIAPQHAPLMLTSLQRRLELFADAGVAVVGVVTFDERVRTMSPEEFCSEVLVAGMDARLVLVGADFHFGRDRAGTPEVLRAIGDDLGFEVTVVPLVGDDDGISSSAIRRAVAAGRVDDAAEWLGRPYRVVGTVVEGKRRGAAAGFPTANLEVGAGLAVPGRGVYAVVALVGADSYPAVANIGVRPTFGGDQRETVEVHLLDYSADLYGTEIGVDFLSRIRDELAFPGVDELVAQITADVATARRLLATSDDGSRRATPRLEGPDSGPSDP
jgi:riboflavin kinase/FMN adenylyltransferase